MKSLLIAISTLTLLPVPTGKWTSSQLKISVAFYPLVGFLLGGLFLLSGKLHLAHDLKALLLLLLWVITTGAFHLDGLGDCLDGFFGGKTPGERRRIMKDSAIGVYAATGIFLVLLLKYQLLTRLLSNGEAWRWLLFIPMAARWAVTLSCLLFTAPPGDRGLGAKVVGFSPGWFASSTLVTLAAGVALLQFQAFEALLIGVILSVAVGLFSLSRIKGLTGDGMGATIEIAEVSLLFLACLNFA